MTTVTRTECEVADQIVHWFEVQEGEAVLWAGTIRRLERMWPLVIPSKPEFVGVILLYGGETEEIRVNSNHLTAVRRYVESGPAPKEG